MLAFDHVQHRVWIIRNVFTEGAGSLREKYDTAVREIQQTRRLLEGPLPRQAPSRDAGPLRVRSNMTKAGYTGAVRKAKSAPKIHGLSVPTALNTALISRAISSSKTSTATIRTSRIIKAVW